jgi:hypothetical protein
MNVYFYTPDFFSGGVKVIYRHASILQEHGISSYVLLAKKVAKKKYFDHETTLKYWDEISLMENDIVVIPEYVCSWMNESKNPSGFKRALKQKFSKNRYRYLVIDVFNSKAKKVIYNQAPYLTFVDYPIIPNNWAHAYHRKDCIGTVCVSENIEQYLKVCFEDLPLFRVYCGLNSILFKTSIKKKKQIAYLTFKNTRDVSQVINIITLRNNLKGFTLLPVYGDENEVAEKFNESMVMLNFGNAEGFGLPPAEAMLSGCIVIGYDGMSGKEFMKPDHCFTIPNGDIISFVKTIELVVDQLSKNEFYYQEMTSKARNFITTEYSEEREKKSVIECWEKLLHLAKRQLTMLDDSL